MKIHHKLKTIFIWISFSQVFSFPQLSSCKVSGIESPTPKAMSNFVVLDENFAIDGSPESLGDLAAKYKSVLYLCPDCDGDSAAGGFPAVVSAWSAATAKHVAVVASDPCFQVNCAETGLGLHDVIAKYAEIERALDSLPRPTFIMCKSNRRAGLMWAVYMGVKAGSTVEEVMALAASKNLTFTGSPGFVAWAAAVVSTLRKFNPILFRQMAEAESNTYTYLLADQDSKECILIDPVLETVERDLAVVEALGLNLKYCLNTHVHADHITGSGKIKTLLAADGKKCESVIASPDAVADVHIKDGERLYFGKRSVIGYKTPGHTAGCFTFILDDFSMVFTGDALLIRGCGRTDFQGGSSETLYHSVHSRILNMRDEATLYPGHDYKGLMSTSVIEERTANPRLSKPLAEFVNIMANLQLPMPKKLEASVPANLKCGL